MATARQLVSAARAMTVPLAMTSPMTTGTRPRRTIAATAIMLATRLSPIWMLLAGGALGGLGLL
jgi:hypothetical protein